MKERPTDDARAVAVALSAEPWALYRQTKNGQHAWDAFRTWRAAAPDEPLPRGLLAFLDRCAAGLLTATTPQQAMQAVGLARAKTGPKAARSGGPGSARRAESARQREGVAMFLFGERKRRERFGESVAFADLYAAYVDDAKKIAADDPDGKEAKIYADGTVRNIATEFGLHKIESSRKLDRVRVTK